MSSDNDSLIKKPIFMKFVLGGLAGAAATTIVQPFFLIQRIYPYETNYLYGIRSTIIKKGFLGLFKGLGPPLVHNTICISLRVGVYSYLEGIYIDKYNEKANFLRRMTIGFAGSTVATLVGSPIDSIYAVVTELRNESIMTKKNLINIVADKIRNEGIVSLWYNNRGKTASNFIQLASYSQSKYMLIYNFQMTEDTNLYILASLISCIAKAFTVIPIKYIKFRTQKINSFQSYCAFFHNTTNLIEFQKYIKEFYWNMTHTVLTFVLLEKFICMYSKYLGVKNRSFGL